MLHGGFRVGRGSLYVLVRDVPPRARGDPTGGRAGARRPTPDGKPARAEMQSPETQTERTEKRYGFTLR